MSAITAGFRAFKETDISPTGGLGRVTWGDTDARLTRYAVLQAYVEGSAYRNIHTWARRYKDSFGQYRYVRDLYNPASALASVYETYVWGGRLDPMAGFDEQSALPIVTDNDALRVALAELWKNSNWGTERNIIPFSGAMLGDAFIVVDDDPTRGIVRMRNLPAPWVTHLDKDAYGNIKSYIVQYWRLDDTDPDLKRQVRYKEIVERDGVNVVYRTFKEDALYAWGNDEAEWELPYGFTPLVHIQHRNTGNAWGWAEIQPHLSLAREVDHLASLIGDKVAQQVNAPILYAGMQPPVNAPQTGYVEQPNDTQEAGRDNTNALYGPADAKAQFLVADLPLTEALDILKEHVQTLEKKLPELQIGTDGEGGVRSGEAERERHQAAENKIQQRRGNYDAGLVKAQQMAISIGGWRGYQGFQGFNLDSYERGLLDHSIAYRDVFRRDERTVLSNAKSLAEVVKMYVDSGAPLSGAAKAAGMTDEEIEALTTLTDADFGISQ